LRLVDLFAVTLTLLRGRERRGKKKGRQGMKHTMPYSRGAVCLCGFPTLTFRREEKYGGKKGEEKRKKKERKRDQRGCDQQSILLVSIFARGKWTVKGKGEKGGEREGRNVKPR